jgi:hypothetical protein
MNPGRPRTPILVIGIVLATLALGIVGASVASMTRRKHHAVRLVEDRPRDAAVADDDDGGPEPTVIPAPTLSTPPSQQRWRLPDGGAPEPCGAARRLRERGDASAALLDKLDEKCRASGGAP